MKTETLLVQNKNVKFVRLCHKISSYLLVLLALATKTIKPTQELFMWGPI